MDYHNEFNNHHFVDILPQSYVKYIIFMSHPKKDCIQSMTGLSLMIKMRNNVFSNHKEGTINVFSPNSSCLVNSWFMT
uniref:Uncharacterized protein n=1 Tax=Glycine max TaxID=3847 RepID=K7MA41_SOYBN